VCGAVLVVQGLKERAGGPWLAWDDWVRSPRHVLGFATVVGAIAFYILAADALGFLLTAPIILTALFLVLKVRPVTALSVAIVGSLLVHFAFYKLLRVPLPWGVLKGYAW
jgi:putative tricarboxylic transport membrane protein